MDKRNIDIERELLAQNKRHTNMLEQVAKNLAKLQKENAKLQKENAKLQKENRRTV